MSDPRPLPPQRLEDVAGCVYGVHLRGRLPVGFGPYLRSMDDPAGPPPTGIEVRYRAIASLPAVDRIWVGESTPRAPGEFALFRQPGGFGLIVSCASRGVFRMASSAVDIEWLPGGAGPAHYFFSYALPLWLESQGVPVLHASAVGFADRAVAFLGRTGVGKSTLCAGLVRAGCRFISDDGLPLREDSRGDFRCAPGPPWIRLWRSGLERGLGLSAERLPRVPESADKRMLPSGAGKPAAAATDSRLAAVYVLEGRSETRSRVAITQTSARESLIRLIQHSLAGAPAAALGLAAQRMKLLSRVVDRTPVRTLVIPAGADHWPQIRQSIADDLPPRSGGS